MNSLDDFSQAFKNGLECWCNNNYTDARYWYEIASKHPKFHIQSISKLIQIDLREGKYANARDMLNRYKNEKDLSIKALFGLLENIENNYERSKKYYNMCLADPKLQFKAIQSLAKLYIQTGDYKIAKMMYETLLSSSDYTFQSTIGLVCMYMLEYNFAEAEKLLSSIDTSGLTPKLLHHYNNMHIYLQYFLGQLKKQDNIYDPDKDYTFYRLFDKSDTLLLHHIERHFNQKYRYSNGCFLKDLDAVKLLGEAREHIEDMNPNHFEISDMYRFKLDKPIGYKGNVLTNDLCVVTLLGTKNIMTMYPVLLSDEFDLEGASKSKELKMRRIQGGIKK